MSKQEKKKLTPLGTADSGLARWTPFPLYLPTKFINWCGLHCYGVAHPYLNNLNFDIWDLHVHPSYDKTPEYIHYYLKSVWDFGVLLMSQFGTFKLAA